MIYISDILGSMAVISLLAGCVLADAGKPVMTVATFLLAVGSGIGWYRESGQMARDKRDEKRRTAEGLGRGL